MPDAKFILDTIENGILIVNKDLQVLFWNKWLAYHTGINKEEAQDHFLTELFPDANFTQLKRKVKIASTLNSSTFTSSLVDKYVIPIRLNKITKSIFTHMRQDVVITPLTEGQISIIIYDTSPLLEAKTIIDKQLHAMEKQATTDALTMCYNRKMFNDLLNAEVKKAGRHKKPLSLVILDIDNFKSVNDTHGHLIGDEVLKEMTAITRETIRESDIFARWGGEEFSILLPETVLEGGATLAEKVRSCIRSHRFNKVGNLTCSFGVAEFIPGEPKDTLISNADWALYHSKNNGKNQVAVFEDGEIRTWHKMDNS
ncbi:MAG: sensor domain-containing diguanylate cyclase [Thermodesulfobacteriota bacterium]